MEAITAEKPLHCAPVTGKLEKRPALRGKIHLGMALVLPMWLFWLFPELKTPRAKFWGQIAVLASCTNFSLSAVLHNISWSKKWYTRARYLDYAGIITQIIGSAIPAIAAPTTVMPSISTIIIRFAMGIIVSGVVLLIACNPPRGLRHWRAGVFLLFGWIAGIYSMNFTFSGVYEMTTAVAMGVCYTLGALAYGFKWPNPVRGIFEHHEVFHGFCLLAYIYTISWQMEVFKRAWK